MFKGLAAAKSLNKAMIADCHWDDSEEVMAAMKLSMNLNKVLGRYDLKFNSISEEGI